MKARQFCRFEKVVARSVVGSALAFLVFTTRFVEAQPLTGPSCSAADRTLGAAGTSRVGFDVVAQGFDVPWSLAWLPNGDILVAERPGRIRTVRNGQTLPGAVYTRADIGNGFYENEAGLLGLVLDPNFAQNRIIYVYVTVQSLTGSEDIRNEIRKLRLSPDYRSVENSTTLPVNIPGGIAHDGGRLRFGPDGKLYVGTGETFQADLAQDMNSLGGKILRINSDGSIPLDNPFPGSAIYALGIRNTQAFDWIDNTTMIMADHGPSGELGRTGHDEVNIVSAGQNLGWPTIYACQARGNLISPLITWVNPQAPGGLAIYRGTALQGWQGDAVVGMLRSGHLHRVKTAVNGRSLSLVTHESYFSGTAGEFTGTTRFGRLREVISGPDNELYVTTSNCDGRGRCPAGTRDMILKLVPR